MITLTPGNGQLRPDQLAVADTGPNGPQYLRADAAAVWQLMIGQGMPAGHLRSGYRTLDQQRDEVRRAAAGLTPSALPAGQSFHGEGIAADADEPARSWLWEHGLSFGVIVNTVHAEPWHVLIDPALNTHTEDDLMSALTYDEQRRMLAWADQGQAKLDQVRNALVTLLGRPVGADVDEAQIAALVLAGISPDKIAAAIPDDIAKDVADLLSKRLAN